MNKNISKILLLLLVTLPLLTSCFKDSDADNSHNILDENERIEYLKKLKGTYKGNFYYAYLGKGATMQQDSVLNVEWTLSENGDMTISRLPVSMFAKSLRAGSQYGFLAEEIEKCKDVSVEAKIVPVRTPDGWEYPFAIYPKDNIVLNVSREGINYKVVLYYQNLIKLAGLYFNMEGIYRIHENKMFLTLPIGSSTVNEVQAGALPSMFRYIGTKPGQSKK